MKKGKVFTVSEKLISSASAENTAYELLRKAAHIQEEQMKLSKAVKLINELKILQERMKMIDEMKEFIRQEHACTEQVMDALSMAMDSMSAPTPVSVPLNDRVLLSVKEANAHTGVGQNRLRRIGKAKIGDVALWDGSKLMFKREKLEKYLDGSFSI